MALPMRKEEPEPEQVRPEWPEWRVNAFAAADALRKELGRELRTEMPDRPLTDAEIEEICVALAEESARDWDPNAPPETTTLEEEMRAEGLLPPEEEWEKLKAEARAELRAQGAIPPGC